MPWYLCEVYVQQQIKMIIMRAQKPLILTAISLGVISLETFLGVCIINKIFIILKKHEITLNNQL